jgi:hypothetical protein
MSHLGHDARALSTRAGRGKNGLGSASRALGATISRIFAAVVLARSNQEWTERVSN